MDTQQLIVIGNYILGRYNMAVLQGSISKLGIILLADVSLMEVGLLCSDNS